MRSVENYIPFGAIYFKTYMTGNALYALLFFQHIRSFENEIHTMVPFVLKLI
jgi:hypothetical protein